MKKLSTAALVVLVALAAAKLCLYTVNEREHALVFALGELKEVVSEPGLHAKLPPPFQNVVYLDKRILTLDAPTADLVQTSEKKNLMIDSFVKWRIANPRLYWVSFQGNERAAEDRISALLRDALNQTVNKRTVNGITSRERDVAMLEIRTGLQERVKDVGVEVVDVRLKRVDFTPEISESVYRRMEAERKRVAAEERSTGAAEAEKIRADADRQRAVGDAIANATYAQSFSKNAEFARFYRNLEAYRASFANKKDVMVVDPSADFFKYMKEPEAK